jgi:hypothetical protein
VRRFERVRKLVKRYSLPDSHCAFVLTATDDEPKLVREVVDSIEGRFWKASMVEEMESLHKNEMWDLVELPSGKKLIGSKWVFKKINASCQVEKFKAQLVEKGYSQVEGVNFNEIFSPVAKLISIRVLMSLVATFDFDIEKKDVKTTFLHGDMEEEIYMKQSEGFVVKGNKKLVCRLKRSFYGLKQSPRMWYQKFDTYILSLRFVRSKDDHCIYSRKNVDVSYMKHYMSMTCC